MSPDYFSRKYELKGGVLTNYNFLGISYAPNDDSISMLKVVILECSMFNSNKYVYHISLISIPLAETENLQQNILTTSIQINWTWLESRI